MPELVRRFPNITVVDVSAILAQLRNILDQVARAVQFIFLFTLAAGAVVLYGAVAASYDERRHELAILRALGGVRRQLGQALWVEFAAIGALAGLLASCGSLIIGMAVARQVFSLELAPSLGVIPLATMGAAIAVALVGRGAAAGLFRASPLESLRAAG